MESKTDDFRGVRRLRTMGCLLTSAMLVMTLAMLLSSASLVFRFRKINQSRSQVARGSQLISNRIEALMKTIDAFEGRLEDILEQGTTPEGLGILLYGDQPGSLTKVFDQVRGLEEAEDEIQSASSALVEMNLSLALPIMMGFLAMALFVFCCIMLLTLNSVSKKINRLVEKREYAELVQLERPARTVEPPRPSTELPNPLSVFVGRDAAENVLGTIYQVVYAYEHDLAHPKAGYMVALSRRLLDLFQSQYDLQPIGRPGEGPIRYDSRRHVCWEFADEGDPVWVTKPGWEHNAEVYAKALVSKKKRPIIS